MATSKVLTYTPNLTDVEMDYLIDNLNTEIQNYEEDLRHHANNNPCGCLAGCWCVDSKQHLTTARTIYNKLRGDKPSC